MDRKLHIEVDEHTKAGAYRRIMRVSRQCTKQLSNIFYEFEQPKPLRQDEPLDAFAFATILHAMTLGESLIVHGPLSETAQLNLEEIQDAWVQWRPEKYKRVDIIPEKIVDARTIRSERRAISAFSGGVDATFTALRHRRNSETHPYRRLTTLLLVHGLDVALDNKADFKRLVQRQKPFIEEYGLELRTIRTNSRCLQPQSWEDSHANQIAACLHQFADEFEIGFIGSSQSYRELSLPWGLPWGSNPVTDHYLSGDRFSIFHDGAGFSRTEKTAEILGYPTALNTLKFCWEGAYQDRNCGKCEKCIRTRLNILAAGGDVNAGCFTTPFDYNSIGSVEFTPKVLQEYISLAEFAEAHGISAAWLDFLQERLQPYLEVSHVPSVVIAKHANVGLRDISLTILEGLGLKTKARKAVQSAKRLLHRN